MKKRKIGKFRKWLIEKLGGIVDAPIPQILIEKYSTETIESRVCLTTEEQLYLFTHFPNSAERDIKQDLWQKIGEKAIPLMTVYSQKNEKLNTMVYKGKITIIKHD